MREAYARYAWRVTGLEIEVGLQWHPNDETARSLWRRIRDVVAPVLAACRSVEADDMTLDVEMALHDVFPERAYFIEVSDGDEQWTQVFDPRGFVKERCDCPCRVNA